MWNNSLLKKKISNNHIIKITLNLISKGMFSLTFQMFNLKKKNYFRKSWRILEYKYKKSNVEDFLIQIWRIFKLKLILERWC